jgi:hypothetical protein
MFMSLLHRGAVGLALTALVAAGLAPAAHADNFESDTLVGGTAALGNVCRGATATGAVGFVLSRNGNAGSTNVWASSARVTVTPGSQPAGLTLGSTSGATPSTWTAASTPNNTLVDVGDASVSLLVPSNAALGVRSASVLYSATGAGSGGGTLTRTATIPFSWNVVDCTPADTTAPVIGKVLAPVAPDGANGWYRSNVAVDWTVSDPESPFTTQGCVDVGLTRDGTLTSSCSASSPGGSAGPVSVTVKRDATAPVLDPVVTGDLGDNGWYVGDVAVSWTATDATSGLDPATACAPASLAADATSRTFSCSVSDLAGNVATSSVTVKRDATDPVIVSHVAGTSGSDGWYTGDVDVTWDVSDATSSVASRIGCDKVTLDHDSAGTSYTCTAKDDAGNETSRSVSVKRDATAPSATFTLDGTQGDAAWFRGPVTLDWTVSDSLSGLGAVVGCVDQGVSGDGRHQLDCAVTDGAGNATHATALVDIDGTAPVITPEVSGPRKGTDWFTGDASVTWTVTDPASGLARATSCDRATVTEDTDGTTFTCSATDVAGNTDSRSVTVRRDATAPVVESDVSGTHAGEWYTGDATVAWRVSDATSGVGNRSDCGTVVLDQDTRGKTYTCSVTDRAGNQASASETLKRDTTAPAITPHLQGLNKGTDWFTGDVSVTWTVEDVTSGVASRSHCDEATVTEDTDGTTYTCAATDNAGNGTSESVTVKRDATAPVVTPHTTGVRNGDWFTGDVAVTWTVEDAPSGVAKTVGCDPVTLGTDTLEQDYTCTATDGAGNRTDGSTTVKRDATAPLIAVDVQGPKKGTDWYTGDVSVTWTVTDATSDVATTSGCAAASVTADTDGTTYTCAATDNAGNGTSRSVTVKRDATAPVVVAQVVGTHSGDWYTGDVTVGWAVSDATSGIASSSGCGTSTLATDTSGKGYTCAATDKAGNKATESTTVMRDATKPVITVDVSGPRKGTDWFTGDVSVSWTVTDATSGVASRSGCEAVTRTADTTGVTYTCAATDVAGNPESRSVTVKRDATAPTLAITGGPADGATYHYGDVPSISTCVATDVVSQPAGPCTVTNDGVLVGSHTQVTTATDNAGNVAREERRYTVAAWRLDGFYKPVTMGATVVNTVKAGSTVPLKFNVYRGTTAMTSGIGAVFTAAKVACDGSDVQDPVDFVTTGGTSLRYDSTAGQWIQNWATPSAGKGSCYRVTMTTADGSAASADFALK